MTNMAWSGASVLHSRGAHLAAKYNIPVEYIIRRNYDASKDAGVGAGAGYELYEDDEVIEEDCYEDE